MPDIVAGPPEPGSYKYVLVNTNLPRGQTYTVGIYGAVSKTRVVEWPEEWPLPNGYGNPNTPTEADRRCVMAFVGSRHLRDRLVTFEGYKDVTRQWFDHLGHPGSSSTPGVDVLDDIGETNNLEAG